MAEQELSNGMKSAIEKAVDQSASSTGFLDEELPIGQSSDPVSEAPVNDNKPSEKTESAEAPSVPQGEGKEPPKQVQEDESHLPDELKTPKEVLGNEVYEKRVKGFQSAFTKKMQGLEQEIRSEYENKFREVLAKFPGQQTNQPQPSNVPSGESLADFFPGVPREQLEPLDKAIKAMLDKRVAPIQQENAQLKGYMNQSQQAQETRRQWDETVGLYPDAAKRSDDLVAWAQMNPQLAAGRTIVEMYRNMTYDENIARVKTSNTQVLKQKEKESVETDSVPNTVSNKKPKNLAEAIDWAAEKAFQEVKAKYSKK